MHKISQKDYAQLVKDIEREVTKRMKEMSGSGMYDFAAAETYVGAIPEIPFFVHVDSMKGGGFKDTLKGTAKKVLAATKAHAAKAKDKAAEAVVKHGAKAIDAVADKINSVAKQKGVDVSHLTNRGKEAAQKALADSQGAIRGKLDDAHRKLEDAVSGSGMEQAGAPPPSGSGMRSAFEDRVAGKIAKQAGSGMMQTGDGMLTTGSGHYVGGASGFIKQRKANIGMPPGSMTVSASNHISSRMPAGGY